MIAENPRTDITDLKNKQMPLKSKCTLVICKNGLCETWRSELTLAGLTVCILAHVPKEDFYYYYMQYGKTLIFIFIHLYFINLADVLVITK